MFKITSTICAAVVALSVPFAAPASAMPMGAPAVDHSLIIPVQGQGNYGDGRDWRTGKHWGSDRRWIRRHYYRDRDRRSYRRHYHRRHGSDFPAGLITGAIIGGALASQPRVEYRPRYSGGSAHVDWCYDRYRSYRAYDNTFQPYRGPRRQCYSPYS